MVEKAKKEGEKGKWGRVTNRRIWIKRVEWRWMEGKEDWERVEEKEVVERK